MSDQVPLTGGSAVSATPTSIPGDIYIWLARGEKGITKKSKQKIGIAIVIVLIQMIAPSAIAYYFCSTVNWSTLWKFDVNLLTNIDLDFKAPGNPLPFWPNALAKKFIAAVTYFVFVSKLSKAIANKEKNLAKMKLSNYIESSGDKFWLCLEGPILSISYLSTAFATWIVLLLQPDVMSVFTNVTGLALLVQLDQMDGVDLSPLTEDDWDPAAEGQIYYDKVKGQFPNVDPNDTAAMKPYLEQYRDCLMGSVSLILYGMSFVFAVLFFFIDQTKIEQYTDQLM